MSPLQPFCDGPIAHRCLHDLSKARPENSWEALDAAIDLGLAVEIDLQLSSDGQVMVFHDYTLDRLTEEIGAIRERSADELTKIPLSGGAKGIPKLTDFLNHTDGRVPLLIEIKDQSGDLGDATSGIEAAVCDALKGYTGPAALMSFNPHIIARCAKLTPEIPRGLVTDPFEEKHWPDVPAKRRAVLAGIPDYEPVGASFISHNAGDLDAPIVADLKARGAKVFCWTIRSLEEEAKARRIVDSVTFEGYLPNGVA